MTTTVLLGISGNKAVEVDTPNGKMVLRPGHWLTLGIHGEQAVRVQETGEFVSEPAGYSFIQAAAADQK